MKHIIIRRPEGIRCALTAFLMTVSALCGCTGKPDENAFDHGGDAGYERIICMSPAVAELVFSLGQGSRVAGVSDYTTYPPEAGDLPRCGGYMNPNYEIILSLRPDLIITQGAGRDMKEFGHMYGVPVKSLQITGLESVYAAIREIGEVLDCKAEAVKLVETMRGKLSGIAVSGEGREPIDTLLVTGRDPGGLREIHVAGPGGFLHDLLLLAGGRNIAGDIDREYFTISKEIVSQRAPEVIIEFYGEGEMSEDRRDRYLGAWRRMSEVPAVRDGRVYVIEETFALIPGPRLVKIAQTMAGLLHGCDESTP